MENKTITLGAADLEKLENLTSYYQHHTVRKIYEHRAEFVVDDLESIIEILGKIFE